MSNTIPPVDFLTDIVWIQTAFIGDLVLNSSAIELIHTYYPKVKIHLITSQRAYGVFLNDQRLSTIHILDKKSKFPIKSFSKIKKELHLPKKTTLIFQPHKSLRSTLLSLYLSRPFITFKDTTLSSLATGTVPYDRSLHEARRLNMLLQVLNIDINVLKSATPKLTSFHSTNLELQSIIKDTFMSHKRLVCIAPSSEWPTKCWPVDKFITLCNLLNESYQDLQLLLIGATKDWALNEKIKSSVPSSNIINLAGKTQIQDLRFLLPKCSLMISGDSGPMHIASSFNIPTVVLFGPTSSSMGFTPLCDRQEIVELELDCRPCSKHGTKVCPLKHFKCMLDLDPRVVLKSCKALLGS